MIDSQSKIKIVKETLYKKAKEITAKVSKIDYQKYINQVKILKHKMSELFFVLCLKIKKLEIKNKGIKACTFLSDFLKWSINIIRAKSLQLMATLRRIESQYFVIKRQDFKIPFIIVGLFYFIAIVLTVISKEIFYLFNFVYIGSAAGIGVFLSSALKKEYFYIGRRATQLLIGGYLFIFLGLLGKENMQIEGFLFYLSMGIFSGAFFHYLIAKIIGPFIFGRGWCGWACWTAMILDLLPWKHPHNRRVMPFEIARYGVLVLSILIVLIERLVLHDEKTFIDPSTLLFWFVVGNLAYYTGGIGSAYLFKDNRAFCKYFCPIAVIMKQSTRFSVMKVEIDKNKCDTCGLCEKNCMMDIRLLDYISEGARILSTECILCCNCIDNCPNNAIKISYNYDYEHFRCKEKLNYMNESTHANPHP